MRPGNRTDRRGRKLRLTFSLAKHKEAAAQLRLIAWRRYGRPTTPDEESAVLAEIIGEAASRSGER